jgi:hypothetical protein
MNDHCDKLEKAPSVQKPVLGKRRRHIPDIEEVTDNYVDQNNNTTSSNTLDRSTHYQHSGAHSCRAYYTPSKEYNVRHQDDVLPPEHIGEFTPQRNRSGIGQQVCRTCPSVQGVRYMERMRYRRQSSGYENCVQGHEEDGDAKCDVG